MPQAKVLSDSNIRKLKPTFKGIPSRPDKHSAQQGLQLLVRSSGTRTWISTHRFNVKQQKTTSGTYPQLGLAETTVANTDISGGLKSVLAIEVQNKLMLRFLILQDFQLFDDHPVLTNMIFDTPSNYFMMPIRQALD